jgi:hypothetical protein
MGSMHDRMGRSRLLFVNVLICKRVPRFLSCDIRPSRPPRSNYDASRPDRSHRNISARLLPASNERAQRCEYTKLSHIQLYSCCESRQVSLVVVYRLSSPKRHDRKILRLPRLAMRRLHPDQRDQCIKARILQILIILKAKMSERREATKGCDSPRPRLGNALAACTTKTTFLRPHFPCYSYSSHLGSSPLWRRICAFGSDSLGCKTRFPCIMALPLSLNQDCGDNMDAEKIAHWPFYLRRCNLTRLLCSEL